MSTIAITPSLEVRQDAPREVKLTQPRQLRDEKLAHALEMDEWKLPEPEPVQELAYAGEQQS